MVDVEASIELVRRHVAAEVLSAEQELRVMEAWLDAGEEDRKVIASIYHQLFASQEFVQRFQLMYQRWQADQLALRHGHPPPQQVRAGWGSATGDAGANGPAGEGTATKANGAGGKQKGKPTASALVVRKLARELDNVACKLMGAGPYSLSFHAVTTQEDVDACVALYASQFRDPSPTELRRIITLPRRSTKRRAQVGGDFTWFLKCHETDAAVCTVTVTVHGLGDGRYFAEMPLFATASGYKKLGFARLLYAALQDHCASIGTDFILISAEKGAVAFWKGLGLVDIGDIRQKIAFFLETDCHRFHDSQHLVWRVPPAIRGTVKQTHAQAALAKMPRFVCDDLRLPLP